MSNNYTQTSFYFQCGTAENAAKVKAWINGDIIGVGSTPLPDDLRKLMIDATGEETFAGEGGALEYTIAEAEIDANCRSQVLWVHIDESGDLELLAAILAYAMDHMPEVEDRQGFQWAETCSKPRIDEFGGGACFIRRGHDVAWLHTSSWLAGQAGGAAC